MRLAEVSERDAVELAAELFADDRAARQRSDILQHSLAAVTEARSLDSQSFERAAQLVDDNRRQGFAVDILSDDGELLAGLDNLLEDRQDVVDGRDLAVRDEDVRIVERCLHLVRIRDEVRRDVAAIELHAFLDREIRAHRLGLLDRDDAVLADLLHGLSDELARLFVCRRDRSDLSDVSLAFDLLGLCLDFVDERLDGFVNALLDDHRVCASSDVLHAFMDHGLCEERCRRRTITGDVVRLRGDFLDELCAHVLKRIFELDVACNRDTIVRDRRSAELLVEDDVAALRSKRYLYGICQCINTAAKCAASFFIKQNLFCHLYYLREKSVSSRGTVR